MHRFHPYKIRWLTACVLAMWISPAHADFPFDLKTLLDDTAVPEPEPPPPAATWPNASRIDTLDRTITFDWRTDEPDETLPFSAIVVIERTRAYEEHPDELFAVISDGRRITLCRGDAVRQQVELLRTPLAQQMVELPMGEGHSLPGEEGMADPILGITIGGAPMAIRHLGTSITIGDASGATGTVNKDACEGCTPRQEVEKILQQRMAEIRQCYTRELLRQPDLQGKVTVRFIIGLDGKVATATIPMSTIDNPDIETCVRQQVMQIRFPRPPGNETMTINYPLVFSAG